MKLVCNAALEMVEEELPVVPDLGLAHNAQILLEACHGAGLLDWSIALALALENTLLLSGALQYTRRLKVLTFDRLG